MANYLDTGDTGRAVSAESDGALLAGIFGSAKYVLEMAVSSRLKYSRIIL